METGCFLQHFITKGVIAGIVEHDFFYYIDVFFLYSFDKRIYYRQTKCSENFIKY